MAHYGNVLLKKSGKIPYLKSCFHIPQGGHGYDMDPIKSFHIPGGKNLACSNLSLQRPWNQNRIISAKQEACLKKNTKVTTGHSLRCCGDSQKMPLESQQKMLAFTSIPRTQNTPLIQPSKNHRSAMIQRPVQPFYLNGIHTGCTQEVKV